MPIPVLPVLDPCTIALVTSVVPDDFGGGLVVELTGAVLTHLLGNKYEDLRKKLKAARPDVNQDLQNALTGSFWSSLLFVVADHGEQMGRPMSALEKWSAPSWVSAAWQAGRNLDPANRKSKARQHHLAPLFDALYPELQKRIKAPSASPGALDKAYRNFQQLLTRSPKNANWIVELELAAVEQLRGLAPTSHRVPDEIEADLRDRFRPLFRSTFAAAIKSRPEVAAIAHATLLAEVHGTVRKIHKQTSRIDANVQAIKDAVVPAKPKSRARPVDIEKYRKLIREETGVIHLGALRIKSVQENIPIDELWVPATTLLAADDKQPARGRKRQDLARVHAEPERLEHAVNRHRVIAIQGEAGTGKSTFVKRLAFELCRLTPAPEPMQLQFHGMPLCVTVKELETFIVRNPHGGDWPTKQEDPAWLAHCLADAPAARAAGLDAAWFDEQLEDPEAILLVDGLDEASKSWRQKLATLVLAAAKLFHCRIVVTMRPEAEQSERLLNDTARYLILPMEKPAVDHFIRLWTKLAGSGVQAEAQARRLTRNLEAKPAIRAMARNPLMLTVLAVLTTNGQELPEQRAALLKEIVEWLAKSKLRDETAKVDKLLNDLSELALLMISQSGQNKYAVGCDTAAEWLARYANRKRPDIQAARDLLEEAELRTGLVADRNGNLVFWHRYFQEYLAASALSFKPDRESLAMKLLASRQSPEVLRLLAGCMAPRQGENLDRLFLHLIKGLKKLPQLEPKAYGVGVLAGMREDLEPTSYVKDKFLPNVEPAYNALVKSVLGIFDPKLSSKISIPDRVAAAEALAAAGGDTRLRLPVERLDKHHRKYWVKVEGGSFLMGAQKEKPDEPGYDADAYDDEGPPRMEPVSTFWLGRFPVTVFEYQRYLEDIGREPSAEWSKETNWEEQLKHLSRPVVRLTLQEAVDYCEWAGGRLPTEVRWEFAARGPGDKPRRFPWGDADLTAEHANWQASNVKEPSPVGLFPLGDALVDGKPISDLSGNVWEWTSSKYGTTGSYVLRGGCFSDDGASYLRAAFRVDYQPEDRSSYFGFRCAREVSP